MKLLIALVCAFVFSGITLEPEAEAGQCPAIRPFCMGHGEKPCCLCDGPNDCEWSCCVQD